MTRIITDNSYLRVAINELIRYLPIYECDDVLIIDFCSCNKGKYTELKKYKFIFIIASDLDFPYLNLIINKNSCVIFPRRITVFDFYDAMRELVQKHKSNSSYLLNYISLSSDERCFIKYFLQGVPQENIALKIKRTAKYVSFCKRKLMMSVGAKNNVHFIKIILCLDRLGVFC